MSFKKWLMHERSIWHKRFLPSLIAGVAVAIISLFFEMTVSNIVLLASLGSSAAILTHKQVHKLTILRTVILSYVVALVVSLGAMALVRFVGVTFPVAALVGVTFTTIGMYLLDVFHPPAVSASLAFVMFHVGFWEITVIFTSVILLLILTKLMTYAFYYEHLEMKHFWNEFKKIEDKS